jgi:hypothetical protein
MGTQRGQMKGVLSWLVHWACRASSRDFCSAMAAQAGEGNSPAGPSFRQLVILYRKTKFILRG